MSERWHRRSIRLKGYDYAQAGVRRTADDRCTHEPACPAGRRGHLFGHIADGVMVPNALGTIVHRCWDAIPQHMPMVVCDAFVVMPNHVHGIVVIRERLVDVRGHGASVVGMVGADHDRPDTTAVTDAMSSEQQTPTDDERDDNATPTHNMGRIMIRPYEYAHPRRPVPCPSYRMVRWGA